MININFCNKKKKKKRVNDISYLEKGELMEVFLINEILFYCDCLVYSINI
jgi:hypothetical protein